MLLVPLVAPPAADAGAARPSHILILADDVKTIEPAKPDPVATFRVPPGPGRSVVKPDGR